MGVNVVLPDKAGNPMPHTFRTIMVWSCVIALISQSGCTTIPPPYLPEEVRAQLGNVGIVPAGFRPDADLSVPAKGWLAGAWRKSTRWAGKGSLKSLEGIEACRGDSSGGCGILVIAISVAAGAIGGVAGGVAGAVQAEPYKKIDLAEEIITTVIDSLNMQESLCSQVALLARKQTRAQIVVVADQGPAAPEEKNTYGALAGKGIDTVLEVAIPRFALAGDWDINPPLQFRMDAHIRLIRTSDGSIVHETTINQSGSSRTFYEWADDNARAFFDELDEAYRILAERIVGEVFLLDPQKEP